MSVAPSAGHFDAVTSLPSPVSKGIQGGGIFIINSVGMA